MKEKFIKKRGEVAQLMIYKQKANRIDEFEKTNSDLKNQINQLQNSIKQLDKTSKNKDFKINTLDMTLKYRSDEIEQLKDKIIDFEGEVNTYKSIKIDMQSQIERLNSELCHANDELEESRKRLEYVEQINFNEYSNEGLNFDLSERIKSLEEQNEELKNNQEHKQLMEVQTLEAKLEELEHEKKELIRNNHKVQIKCERFEQEKEAKLLAKEKIKVLNKELRDSTMKNKKISEQLLRSYQEISRLK